MGVESFEMVKFTSEPLNVSVLGALTAPLSVFAPPPPHTHIHTHSPSYILVPRNVSNFPCVIFKYCIHFIGCSLHNFNSYWFFVCCRVSIFIRV